MMAMMDEVLTDLELDVSVWGLRTRVDLVACGDEDGTSPCGWPPGFFLLFNFEINRIMFASSVLMAAGQEVVIFPATVRLNVLWWYASLGQPMATTPATRAE